MDRGYTRVHAATAASRLASALLSARDFFSFFGVLGPRDAAVNAEARARAD